MESALRGSFIDGDILGMDGYGEIEVELEFKRAKDMIKVTMGEENEAGF